MSSHLITLGLIYLLIGSLIWTALDGAGAVAEASTFGRRVTASVMMIVMWPRVARQWIRNKLGNRSSAV